MKSPFRLLSAVAMLASAAVSAAAQSVTVPTDYKEGMNIADGISIVATPEQWDNTCYALIDNPSQIVGIEIVADLDLSDPPTGVVFFQASGDVPGGIPKADALVDLPELDPPPSVFHKTIVSLPVPLNGNGHRIVFHNNTEHKPLIDTITEKGSVRNLSVCVAAVVDHSATFGGLARVNKGAIDGVLATVDLSLNLKEIIMKSMEQDCKVMIGGLVGENLGTISSCHVAARMMETYSEHDAAQMAQMDDGRQMSEVKIESSYFIKSFHLGLVAGHSQGTISDCYVGNVIRGEPVSSLFVLNKRIVYAPTQATQDRLDPAVGEGGKPKAPDLSVSWLGRVDKPATGVVNICPPQMLAEAPPADSPDDDWGQDPYVPGWPGLWKQGADVVFCYGNDSYSLAEKWDEESRKSMTPLSLAEDDALSPLWATDDNLYKFKDPAKWTFNVGPVPDQYSNHFCRYPVPTMRDRVVGVSADAQTGSVSVSVSDTSTFWGVFNTLADANTDFYQGATVTVPQGLVYAAAPLDMGTLTSGNIAAVLDSLPPVPSFRGSFDGAEVRNLAARTSGLFDSVAVGGRVSNLALTGALLYVSPADSHFHRSADTVHVHLLAGGNSGSMTNVAVFGDVIVDEQDLKRLGDTAVVISLVGENDGAALSGYIFIDSLRTTGRNKKMIPIKQNLATGRNKKRSNTKVAARNSAVATTPEPRDTSEYSQGECFFSDKQFADGTVANWLNHQGAGFTGAYRPYWAQGERVPVPAADSTAALYRVQVSIKRGVGDADTTLRHPVFANGGDSITIRYRSKPARVLMGSESVAALGDTCATFVYRGGKTIEVEFGPTSTQVVEPAPLRVAVVGGEVVVSGAEGQVKRLFDAGGRMLAETRADMLSLPRRGLYVVWCDGRVAKVAAGR